MEAAIKTNIDVPEADFAFDDCDNSRLKYLDVLRSDSNFGNTVLKNLRVLAVGAGPAGLLFARNACKYGANVTVLEKAGDPRKHHAGYTNRSFNITIDDVGRWVLEKPESWKGGIWLAGRAIHNFKGSQDVHYAEYGDNSDKVTNLISIPRTRLRRNLVNQALHEGAEIKFRSQVIQIDPDEGTVIYKDADRNKMKLSADLIIIGDGLHSIGNTLIENKIGCDKIYARPEPRSYVTAHIRPGDNRKLSLQHIHFWHEDDKEAYTVGIPNGDGTISLLLASKFADFAEYEHPFPTPKKTQELLKKDFAHLYAAYGDQLIEQLPRRSRGYFKYKAVPSYIAGYKAVMIGDAGCAVPPWAGFGANSAMYGAASLVYHLVSSGGNIESALTIFQAQQLSLASKIMDYVNDEGEFLSGPVTENPSGRSDEKLCRLIKEAQQEAFEQLSPIANQVFNSPNKIAVSET